jgi:hypothetical protein
MRNVASEFIKIFSKKAKYDKSLKIHNNGVANNYPDFVESIITESVTASSCVSIMASYLIGKGFGDANKIIVNENKETTLYNFGKSIAASKAEHYGYFIHVHFYGELQNYAIKDMDVLPYSHCRVGQKDDTDYNGKILVCNDWSDSKEVKKAKVVDVYNTNKKVIKEQMVNAGGFSKYNGQILFVKVGKYTYPLSPLHPALKDAESESQVSIYKHTSLKKGFFGKTMVITKPLVDNEIEESNPELYQKEVTARSKFRETIKSFIGAENSDGVLHLELEFNSEKIEDEILFKQIDSNIDDKLFAHTETSVSQNICVAYGIHPNLIRPKDGAMFGQGGEIYKQMKLDFQDKTEDLRSSIQEVVNKLMGKFHEPVQNLQIIPLIKKEDANRQDGNIEA